jgi:hypothetical protein
MYVPYEGWFASTRFTNFADWEEIFTTFVKIISWSFCPSQPAGLLYMLADSIFRLTRKRYQEELLKKMFLGL